MRWTTTHSWLLAAGLLAGLSSCAALFDFNDYGPDAGVGGRGVDGGSNGPGGAAASSGSKGSTGSQSSGSGLPGSGFSLVGMNDESVLGMDLDPDDNIILAGIFKGSIDLGGGVTLATSVASDSGLFLAKFDPMGMRIWSTLIATAATPDLLTAGVAVDPKDNYDVIIAGGFGGKLLVDAMPKLATGGTDVFVSRFSGVNGMLIWSHTYGGSGDSVATAVGVDPITGDIAMTGTFNQDFSPDSVTPGCGMTNNGAGYDAFIAKVKRLSGDCIWLKRTFGTVSARGEGVAIDSIGNIYMSGAFQGTLMPGVPCPDLPQKGIGDTFFIRWDNMGTPTFSHLLAPSGEATVTVDPTTQDILFSGNTVGVPYDGTGNAFGVSDILAAKYSGNGTLGVFAKNFGGSGPDGAQLIGLPSDQLVMAGYFTDTAALGNMQLSSAGAQDAFVALIDAAGNPLAAKTFGDAMNQSILFVRAPNHNAGKVVVAGVFQGTIPFDQGSITSKNGYDIFVGTVPVPMP